MVGFDSDTSYVAVRHVR